MTKKSNVIILIVLITLSLTSWIYFIKDKECLNKPIYTSGENSWQIGWTNTCSSNFIPTEEYTNKLNSIFLPELK